MKIKKISKEEINRIRTLRKKGYSLPEISRLSGISKSTVFRYNKGIDVLPKYKVQWASKRGGSRNRKILKEKKAFEEGLKLVDQLSDRDKLLFISALYWAEGSKNDFGLSNTDAKLIKVFVKILRNTLNVDSSRLRVSIRIYEDLERNKCLDYWSKVVGVPKERFVNVNILPGRKKGKLKYGMCRVRVSKGGDLLKKINGINKAMQEIIAPVAQRIE